MIDDSATDVYELYGVAAEIGDPELREAFIRSHCADDPELGERLRAMLAVREDADALFEHASQFRADASQGKAAEPNTLGRVGRFRLERLIGRGGMGNVFLAHDVQLQRPAALKFPRLDTMGNPELLERFLREARLTAQLHHPNLVDIYEVGVWGQACFIASQWCEGGDLAVWLTNHPGAQDPIWSAALLSPIARAVAYCHRQGVVHLDIKPANIILAVDAVGEGTGRVEGHEGAPLKPMLTDFGVARMIEEGMTFTHSSLVLGTPLYMAPEQAECRRDKIGPGSDIYALGVILYELLYGKRPFEGDSAIEVLDQIRSPDTLVLPSRGSVPRDLRTICQRCLEHQPADRYPSADALAEDLDRYLRGESVHARPVTPLRRLWRWVERPERIVQAGAISMVIQMLIIIDFVSVFAAMALGWASSIEMELGAFAREIVLLMIFPHAPSIAMALLAMRRRRWPVPVGLLLSSLTGVMLVRVLVTGESHIELYEDHPLATFLQHFILLCAMGIQAAAYAVALPAVFRRAR